jgi:hypothetical protein
VIENQLMKSAVERLYQSVAILVYAGLRLLAADETNPIAPAWTNILQSDNPRPFGMEKGFPWTTTRIAGSPDPPLPYVVKRVFPKLNFKEPVDWANTLSLDRLFVAQQWGKIFSFKNDPDVEQPDLVFDLHKEIPGSTQLYGLTFHPGFETNRIVYLCYVLKDGLPDGSRVSRFNVTQSDPPQIDPASEKIIITRPARPARHRSGHQRPSFLHSPH